MIELEGEMYAGGLYDLMETVNAKIGPGYDPSSGIDFKNDVFESWSYWSHAECETCERVEWAAEANVLRDHGWTEEDLSNYSTHLAHRAYPENFSGLYKTEKERLVTEHECPLKDYNFYHYATGLKVMWYKRVGRGTRANMELTTREWYMALLECFDSLED